MSKHTFNIHSAAKEGRQTRMDMLFTMIRGLVSPEAYLTIPPHMEFQIKAARDRLLPGADTSPEITESIKTFLTYFDAFMKDWIELKFPGADAFRPIAKDVTEMGWEFLPVGVNFTFVISSVNYHFIFLPNAMLEEIANKDHAELHVMNVDVNEVPVVH